jgi:hypothetical protein
MKLSYIAEQIVQAIPGLTLNELYASLDFRGRKNAQLAIPDWHTNEFREPDIQRHEFLSGEENIEGDVLTYRQDNQDRMMLLSDFSTLEEAVQEVLGGAGIFNAFVDFVLVFHHFKLRPYQVTYRDHSGARIIWGATYKPEDRPFLDRQIRWL